jgi:hypothetical protein
MDSEEKFGMVVSIPASLFFLFGFVMIGSWMFLLLGTGFLFGAMYLIEQAK